MKTYAGRDGRRIIQSSAEVSRKRIAGHSTFHFVDNRSDAVAQEKLQNIVDNSKKVHEQTTLQRAVDNAVIQRRIVVNNSGAMPGPFPIEQYTNARHNDAKTAIHQLSYANIWAGAGTQTNTPNARVDMQGVTAAGQNNLQTQINGVGAPSTVAHILVNPNAQAQLVPAVSAARSNAQQAEIRRRSVGALLQSLVDCRGGNPTTYTVNGPPSS